MPIWKEAVLLLRRCHLTIALPSFKIPFLEISIMMKKKTTKTQGRREKIEEV